MFLRLNKYTVPEWSKDKDIIQKQLIDSGLPMKVIQPARTSSNIQTCKNQPNTNNTFI